MLSSLTKLIGTYVFTRDPVKAMTQLDCARVRVFSPSFLLWGITCKKNISRYLNSVFKCHSHWRISGMVDSEGEARNFEVVDTDTLYGYLLITLEKIMEDISRLTGTQLTIDYLKPDFSWKPLSTPTWHQEFLLPWRFTLTFSHSDIIDSPASEELINRLSASMHLNIYCKSVSHLNL